MKNNLTDFTKGVIAGVVCSVILFGGVFAVHVSREKDREIVEYAEKRIEIENLREDYLSRDPYEFMELPGVGTAAGSAREEFDRKRNEALQRFRSGLASRADLVD